MLGVAAITTGLAFAVIGMTICLLVLLVRALRSLDLPYLAMGVATGLLFFVSLLLHELEARREGLVTRHHWDTAHDQVIARFAAGASTSTGLRRGCSPREPRSSTARGTT